MHLNHPKTTPLTLGSVEKLSSTKLIASTKKVGEHCRSLGVQSAAWSPRSVPNSSSATLTPMALDKVFHLWVFFFHP